MMIQKEEEMEKMKGRTPITQFDSLKRSNSSTLDILPTTDIAPSQHPTLKLLDHNSSIGPQIQDKLNREYIKKCLFKYLEYQATGNEKEAILMEKVLFTVL